MRTTNAKRTLYVQGNNGTARGINALLDHAIPDAPLTSKLDWIEYLFRWLRISGPIPSSIMNRRENIRSAKLRLFLLILREHPEKRKAVGAILRSLLNETSGLLLFVDVGLPSEAGFVSEAAERILKRTLPQPPRERELSELVSRLFVSDEDARWLEALPKDLLEEFSSVFSDGLDSSPLSFENLKKSMTDAILVLSVEICALGLSEEIRSRSPEIALRDSPFLSLGRRCEDLASLIHVRASTERKDAAGLSCFQTIEGCRRMVNIVGDHLEDYGISINLVYRLEKISSSLTRIEDLLKFLIPQVPVQPAMAARFLAHLAEGSIKDRSVRELVRANLRQISRKVVERAGITGEHYITRTGKEYLHMLASAGGGGFLTLGTTLLKFVIVRAKFPFFFDGLFSSINYAGSFLLMQMLGFKLATKQPSMTAAALAGKLHAQRNNQDLGPFVDEVARITRSQFAAAVGNVGMVIPCAILFDLLFARISGRHFLDLTTADYVIQSVNPVQTLTILYAFITGFLLWLSSVAGGWIENFSVYRRISEGIAHNRPFSRMIGTERTGRIAQIFQSNISGVGSAVTLGVLLGMLPIMGKFFGIPLDVRHITLTAGSLALAASSIGLTHLLESQFLWAYAGLIIIGLLNFGVSFGFALAVAMRARELDDRKMTTELRKAVFARLLKAPRDFFIPPRPLPDAATTNPSPSPSPSARKISRS